MSDPRALLRALFDADRKLREAERAFLRSADDAQLARVLAEAARRALEDEGSETQEMELVRLADLCAQVPGPVAVDTLLAILGHSDPAVRAEAGEALLDVAYERFKEVATAIERALDEGRSGLAMEELPFILVEIHEPDPLPLLMRFLSHPQAEVVAAAIEAIVERADPVAVPALSRLRDDAREVTLPELDDEKVTVGDLAADALAFFDEVFGEDEAFLSSSSQPASNERPAREPGRSRARSERRAREPKRP